MNRRRFLTNASLLAITGGIRAQSTAPSRQTNAQAPAGATTFNAPALSTLSLHAEHAGTLPYMAAVYPLEGVVPSGATLGSADEPSLASSVLSRWPDGSAAVVVIAGEADVTPSSARTVALRPTTASGTALTPARVGALVRAVAIDAGPLGSVTLNRFDAPQRIWWANARVICCRYRAALDAGLEAVIEGRRMTPFKARRRGGITATFDSAEANVIANLASQVVELLRDRNGERVTDTDPLVSELGLGGPSQPPEDPVLQRLLPDAYRDSVEDSAEFRRFTESALSSAKVANAEMVLATLAAGGFDITDESAPPVEIELGPDEVQAWLRSLTDIRLSLAVRLGIENEEDAMLLDKSSDPALVAMGELYDWLGYVQETLVQALS